MQNNIFSKFYIDKIAMRKKRAKLAMHTLYKKLKNPSFFPEHSSDVDMWWIKLLLLKLHSADDFEENTSVRYLLMNAIGK